MTPEIVRNLTFGAISPSRANAAPLLDSIVRAGGLAIVDASVPGWEVTVRTLLAKPDARVGVLADLPLTPETGVALDRLPRRVELLAARSVTGGLDGLRNYAETVFALVTSEREAGLAVAAGVDGLIAKGNEAGGAVGSESTFVLLQRLCACLHLPVWAYGGIGPNGAAACVAGGARGIVLQDQLALVQEAGLPEVLRNHIAAMDGTETVCLGEGLGQRFRVHRRHAAELVRQLKQNEATLDGPAFAGAIQHALERPAAEAPLAVGQDAAFAARLAERYRTAGGILRAYRRQMVDNLRLAAETAPLAEDSPLARDLRPKYPIVQGPMTRVSDVAGFANAVSLGGGLPFLALALMRGEECEILLRETAAVIENRAWGVGILAFAPKEIREEQLKAVLKVHPPFAILAGGRPDQVRTLEVQGHLDLRPRAFGESDRPVPAPRQRKFILEGRECGGHVGPLASLVLWESALEAVLAFQTRAQHVKTTIDILFAGGIHDARSAAMVSAMAGSAHAAGSALAC